MFQVERESIDFVDRTLSIWNQEILCTAGVLLRVVYEDEMKAIGGRNSGPASNANATDSQLEAAAHLMTAFTFHPSTPSPYVEQIMKQLFFKGASHALTILSTLGRAEEVTRVRLYDQHIAQFCPSLAMVPPIMGQKCREFLDELRTAGTLQPVSLADVADAVTKVEATEEHVAAFIRWWAGNYSRFTRNDEHHMRCILGAIKVNMEGAPDPSGDGKNRIMTVALQDIRYFANHRIPAALPLPPSTLPISISQRVGRKDFHVGFGYVSGIIWRRIYSLTPPYQMERASDRYMGSIHCAGSSL